jgi:hypothetical protein
VGILLKGEGQQTAGPCYVLSHLTEQAEREREREREICCHRIFNPYAPALLLHSEARETIHLTNGVPA